VGPAGRRYRSIAAQPVLEISRRTRKRKKRPGEMEADAAVTAYRRVKASDEVCALDTIVAGLIARFQQLCTKRSVSCWTLNDS